MEGERPVRRVLQSSRQKMVVISIMKGSSTSGENEIDSAYTLQVK